MVEFALELGYIMVWCTIALFHRPQGALHNLLLLERAMLYWGTKIEKKTCTIHPNIRKRFNLLVVSVSTCVW